MLSPTWHRQAIEATAGWCRRVGVGLTVLAISVLVAPGCDAEDRIWQPAGFGGAGNFATVRAHPTQPGVAYATSDVSGVFRSTDFGETWVMRNTGLGNYEVSSFAIDPFDPDTLYAGVGAFDTSVKAGLYVSRDAGASWRHLTETAERGIAFRLHRTPGAIGLDPAQPGVVVVGSRSTGIWRSTDHGETWMSVFSPPMTGASHPPVGTGGLSDDPESDVYAAPITTIAFDPAADGTLYAGVYGGGVVRSNSGGATGSWTETSMGLPPQAIVRDIVIASDRTVYIAAGAAGVYRSTDRGERWHAANGGLPLDDFHAFALAVDPTNSNIVYLAQQFVPNPGDWHSPVWKSTNGGETWFETGEITFDTAANPTYDWIYDSAAALDVAVDPADPSRLYFAGAWGLYRSDDAGGSWRANLVGAQNTCVTDVTVAHGSGGERLYATHLDAGLLSSSDKGATWRTEMPTGRRDREGRAGHHWRYIAIGADGTALLTTAPWGGRNKVFKRSGGGDWRAVFESPVGGTSRGLGGLVVAAHPTSPNILFMAQDGGSVYQSLDAGESWSLTGGQPGDASFNDIAVDEAGRVFVATLWGGVWLSPDGGRSWQRTASGVAGAWDLALAPGAIYVAATDGNLYRSHDGGVAWRSVTAFGSGYDSDGTGMNGLAVGVDPHDPAHLVFSRADTWHFADAGEGVYESRDAGQTWTQVSTGLGLPRVTTFAFGEDGDIFAGTFCGGTWRLPSDPDAPR